MDETTKARLREWLVDAVCTGTESPNGIPIIRFGSFMLWVASSWRVTYEEQIVVSSDTDYDLLSEELPAILIGQKIQAIEIIGSFHDLNVFFESGMRLEIFSDSGTHENWNVVGEPDEMVIAGPGALWSAF